ncbi:MAG: hypothetical protein ACMXYD_01395 [Candidatus Woesearchaeota archaeon]
MKHTWILLLFIIVLFVACEEANKEVVNPITNIASQTTNTEYKTYTLTNAFTQKEFRINDYQAHTLLLQPFATWCNSCVEQQRILAQTGYAYIAVGVDPAETTQDVITFAEKNNFSGAYTAADPDFNTKLIRAFSTGVMKVLETPVILICPGGQAQVLPTGINTEEEIRAAARNC